MNHAIVLIGVSILFLSCSQLAEEEKLQRARQAMSAGNYDEALRYYEQLCNEHPGSAYGAEALFARASIHQNYRRDFTTALKLYRELAATYPADPAAPGALFMVGFIFHNELKMVDSARAAYEEFLKTYPMNEMAPSAQFELANLGKEPHELIPPEPSTDGAKIAAKKRGKK